LRQETRAKIIGKKDSLLRLFVGGIISLSRADLVRLLLPGMESA
jgi:hypothetical protein